MSFATFGLHPSILASVDRLGFEQPTPVQKEAIPPALEGRDVLACAMTGSGKTAAFLLPLLQRLRERPRGRTRALVLSPTRELAAQIHEHLEALNGTTGVRGATVFGGVKPGPQEAAFRAGVDVIVATPGRLLDHLQNSYVNFAELEVLVLDEADRMLDMGFLPDIRRILARLPRERQTLFFSATFPGKIAELAQDMLRNPAKINVNRAAVPAAGISQALFPVKEELKSALFLEMLARNEVGNVIVFCRTKHRANRLAEILEKHRVSAVRIHGNRSQSARTEALDGFKAGRYRVLVATDIAARGIDVTALEHVVNFDVPGQPEDYVHRVGRTARAEATGEAYTLVSPEDEASVRAIERAMGKTIPRVKLADFDYSARATEPFEVPLAVRIAEIRRRKAEDRERGRIKAALKEQRQRENDGQPGTRRAGGPVAGPGGQGQEARGERTSREQAREPAMAGTFRGRRGGRGGGKGRSA
jgi:ATP-dependent RNA helicase RhlE